MSLIKLVQTTALNTFAGMVVHPSPGHPDNTLVNAFLFHCGRPAVTHPAPLDCCSGASLLDGKVPYSANMHGQLKAGIDNCAEDDDDIDDDADVDIRDSSSTSSRFSGKKDAWLRPGIVHRLDKGMHCRPFKLRPYKPRNCENSAEQEHLTAHLWAKCLHRIRHVIDVMLVEFDDWLYMLAFEMAEFIPLPAFSCHQALLSV
jgi:hypothetical protein